MLASLTRRDRAPVVGLVLLIVVAWWCTTPRAVMPPVSPMGDQPIYATADAEILPLIEPVIHAPWLGAPSTTTGLVGAVLVVSAGCVAALAGGAGVLATAAAMLAGVSVAGFSMSLERGAGLAWAVGVVWLLAGIAFARHRLDTRWQLSGRNALVSCGVLGVWGLAVWLHPLALVAWPFTLVWWARGWRGTGRVVGLLAVVCVGGVIGLAVLHAVAATVTQASVPLSAPIGWRDVLAVAIDARGAVPPETYAAPDIAVAWSPFVLVLAALGVWQLDAASGSRRAMLTTALGVAAVALLWPAWSAEALRFGGWLLPPLVGCGVTWVARQLPSGWARTATAAALGVVLVADAVAATARPLSGLEPRLFRDALVAALDAPTRAAELVLVAEDTRLDSALAAWAIGRPGVWRSPQRREPVVRAVETGAQVLAGPGGRRHLELSGVVFADAVVLDQPLPLVLSRVTGSLQCAVVRSDAWSQLPGIEYTGRLGIEIPSQLGGELQLVVGDVLPLAVRATADGRPWPVVAVDLLAGPGSAAPPADYWLDGGVPEEGPGFIKRLHFAAHPLRSSLVSLHLGRRAPKVLARLAGFSPSARGSVCAAPLAVPIVSPEGGDVLVPLTSDEAFANGWYGVEGRSAEAFRWAGPDAVVMVHGAARMPVTVTLEAAPAVGEAAGADAVRLRVNGIAVGGPTRPAEGRYTWEVPAGVWLEGTNELWWQTARAVRPADEGGRDTRTLALRVSGLVITPRP